jgi:hypothetical protein
LLQPENLRDLASIDQVVGVDVSAQPSPLGPGRPTTGDHI